MNHTIVVTGIGLITPLGNSVEEFWRSCTRGASGIKEISGFDTSCYKSHFGGEVSDFNPKQFMDPMQYRKMSKASRFAVAASIQALKDASLSISDNNADRVGIIVGTGFGSTSRTDEFFLSLLQEGPAGAQPFLFSETVPNAPASQISIFHGVKGPLSTISHNNVSGELAIGYAFDLLQSGAADAILVGGVEELNDITFHCYAGLGVLSPKDGGREIMKPFDRESNGVILGEGAGVLVLEREEYALKRGITPYGCISGYASAGTSTEMGKYGMSGDQIARTIEAALRISHITQEEIDFISVAANSSKVLDRLETKAIKESFAELTQRVPVTALKSQIGEFAGVGVIRAAAVLLSLRNQVIPPTVNLETQDNECDVLHVVRKPTRQPVKTALLNGISFGGANISIVFKKN
ncbi:MAG: beta-ketoacyl-[acyl-carrier-protein] synthase family protein [Deltaproteobacteria bacterium]|nr:beta-ketoacyl-[acyl-carrier-protein] synthase family protein [Deltaproteobacteria bacterium]